jgi:hypothetical protein
MRDCGRREAEARSRCDADEEAEARSRCDGASDRRTKLRIEGKIRRTKSREADARGGGRMRGQTHGGDASIFFLSSFHSF